MAMLSMLFQLMQDEMVAKFQWLKQKCTMRRKAPKVEKPAVDVPKTNTNRRGAQSAEKMRDKTKNK